MSLFQFSEIQILTFALVFLRVIAFVFTWPIFGSETVPMPVKVLLSLLLAICLFPVQSFNLPQELINDHIISLAAKEVMIGLMIGFLTRFFFFAISIAGEIVSVSSGLSSAQLFNPTMGSQSQVLEQFQFSLAAILFLFLNGHHFLISGLSQSFSIVPLSMNDIKYEQFQNVALLGQDIMFLGLKLSAPVMGTVLIVNVAMGVLGRAVPQINVFSTSMQVTIIIGLGIFFWTLPLLIPEMEVLITQLTDNMFKFMKAI